jgi:hypothetical protein
MKITKSAVAVSMMLVMGLSACATQQSSSGEPAKTKEEIRAEKVAAKEAAEAKKYPPPPPDSPLAKIKRDMTEEEVRAILGPPTTQGSYDTGKRWIPGYGAFAPDQTRTEFIYKGLGLVTFNRNTYTGRLHVVRVVYDPKR